MCVMWKETYENNEDKKISLKFKISFALFFIMLSLLLLAGTCITYRYNQKIMKRSNQHIEENLRIMSNRIENIFKNGNLCANYLVLNLNQIINEEGRQGVEVENEIKTELNQEVLIFEEIHSIVYITKDGQMYATDVKLFDYEEDIKKSSYLEKLKESNGRTQVFDMENTCMNYDKSVDVVTMGKRVNNVITGKLEGYMFLNIEASYLANSVENSISSYFLFDSTKHLLRENAKQQELEEQWLAGTNLSSSTQMIKKEGKRYLFATNEVEGYGWTILGITDLNKFGLSSSEIGIILVQSGLVLLLVLLVVGSAVTKSITKPLENLTEGAKSLAEGNMNVHFEVRTNDEIGTLASVFQYMSVQIKELIEKVDVEATKKREYELALIHEQVKPHFLYNTLDIIIMLIDMKRYRDAQRVTKKLADYYKLSLSGSKEIISLSEEVEMIEDYYLDSQQERKQSSNY